MATLSSRGFVVEEIATKRISSAATLRPADLLASLRALRISRAWEREEETECWGEVSVERFRGEEGRRREARRMVAAV